MSRFFNRLSDFTYDAYRGARRAIIAAMPTVRRRIGEFTNWITGNVPEEQIPQVLDEIVRNVRERYPPRPPRVRQTLRPNFELREEQSAFNNFVTQYVIDGEEGWGPDNFLEAARQSITIFLRSNSYNKVMLSLFCIMKKETDHTITVERPFRSYHEINLRETNVDELYDDMVERVIENLESFKAMGSGWVFHKVISLTLFVGEYRPLQASSWMPLPAGLRNKKLINIQNKDDCNCFQYCVLRRKYPKEKNPQRVDKELKEQIKELNMKGIDCPIKLKDIDKFENQNPQFSIVVIGYDEKDGLYPLRRQEIKTFSREYLVILLLITNEEGNSHYVLVKNPSALFASNLSKDGHKMFFCWSCFDHFTSEEVLRKHQDYCYEHDAVKTVIPEKYIQIMFKNHIKTQWYPFVIYPDFESYLIPINTTSPDPNTSYTKKYQKHEPSGFCFYVKSFNEEVFKSELVEYTGKDVAKKFVEEIEKIVKKIYDIPEVKIIFTANDQEIFNKATECYICKEQFTNNFKNKKVRDHCHYTGKFRGAAHSVCNLKHRKPNFIPVFFHNLSNYDSHLFIKSLGFTEGDINCIPNNEEKYISFTKKVVVDQYYDKKQKQTKIRLLI